MDLKEKKDKLVAEYNQNLKVLGQLAKKNEQIAGALTLIDEIEKENAKKQEDGTIPNPNPEAQGVCPEVAQK